MPEMRNTPPEPDITKRDTSRLIDDLCIALCDVGGRISYSQPEEREIGFIILVRNLHEELKRRSVSLEAQLDQLTEETGWLMHRLLDDCLKWPAQVPWVREKDGIRRMFRCTLCSSEEIPDGDSIWLGTTCLQRAKEAISSRTPFDGIMIYRTYNAEARCRHADEETVLAVQDNEYDMTLSNSFCYECIIEELARRKVTN